MTQTIPTLIEAMLRGLISELNADSAAVVLSGDSPAPVYFWRGRARLPLITGILCCRKKHQMFCKCHYGREFGEQLARLCLYKPGKSEWGRSP